MPYLPGSVQEQADIFDVFLSRLRKGIKGLDQANCFYCDEPIPEKMPAVGDTFVTVAPDGGSFDEGHQAGGGHKQLSEVTTVLITTLLKSLSDQPKHEEVSLFSPDRGLIRVWKPRILRAIMCDVDAATSTDKQWMPCRDGVAMLRQYPRIVRCSVPGRHRAHPQFVGQTIYVEIWFDWKL